MSIATTQNKMVSQLPRPTWNWLHINETQATFRDTDKTLSLAPEPIITVPEGIVVHRNTMPHPVIKFSAATPLLGDIPQIVTDHLSHSLHVEIPAGVHATEPLIIEYNLAAEHSWLANRIFITAQPQSQASVVLLYTGADGIKVSGPSAGADALEATAPASPISEHWGYVTATVAEGADLKLTQLQLLPSEACTQNAISAEVHQDGKLCLLLGEAGGQHAVSNCDVRLSGEHAQCDLNSLYLARDTQIKDINYRITYAAPDTEGLISARGALSGAARKVFKSTIDFLPGASRAKGREEEAVLVLSDQVRNISTPLLLCGEDNVEGQHATNIGRPDPAKLYYLMSRGFTELNAKKLLVEASFAPFLDQLYPASLQERLLERIHEVIHHDE